MTTSATPVQPSPTSPQMIVVSNQIKQDGARRRPCSPAGQRDFPGAGADAVWAGTTRDTSTSHRPGPLVAPADGCRAAHGLGLHPDAVVDPLRDRLVGADAMASRAGTEQPVCPLRPPGVAWLYGVTLLAIVGLLYLVCRRRASPTVAAIVTGISVVGMSGTLAPRPQLVSFALILVVTDAWLRTTSDGKPRWWLIPLTWFGPAATECGSRGHWSVWR